MWTSVRSIVDEDPFSSWAKIVKKEFEKTKEKYPFLDEALEEMFEAKFQMNKVMEKLDRVEKVRSFFETTKKFPPGCR